MLVILLATVIGGEPSIPQSTSGNLSKAQVAFHDVKQTAIDSITGASGRARGKVVIRIAPDIAPS